MRLRKAITAAAVTFVAIIAPQLLSESLPELYGKMFDEGLSWAFIVFIVLYFIWDDE